jgi:hypothetical protein
VEQACAQFPAATRPPVGHQLVPIFTLTRHVSHISSLRGSPRTGHGRSHQEVTMRSSQTSALFICEAINLFQQNYVYLHCKSSRFLIAVARAPAIKRNKFFGNAIIWLALYAGFPLLCVAYVFHRHFDSCWGFFSILRYRLIPTVITFEMDAP